MSSVTVSEIAAATWNIDSSHSSAQFKVKHLMVSNVKGEFAGITGSLQFDPENLVHSRIEATIDSRTINTRDEKRDAHLRSPDFFDVERFPTLSFRSGRVSQKPDGELAVGGDLTIHGVTRPVVFAVEGPSAPTRDPWGGTRIGLTATTRINRKDFGLTWNAALEAGGVVVGEEVTITLEVEFIKA